MQKGSPHGRSAKLVSILLPWVSTLNDAHVFHILWPTLEILFWALKWQGQTDGHWHCPEMSTTPSIPIQALTSVIGGELVYSIWYGRRHSVLSQMSFNDNISTCQPWTFFQIRDSNPCLPPEEAMTHRMFASVTETVSAGTCHFDRLWCCPDLCGPKMWNASRFCVSSLRRGHANLLCIVPILVYVLREQYTGEACTRQARYI